MEGKTQETARRDDQDDFAEELFSVHIA